MSTFNNWGDGVDDSLGDVIYDELEDKVKDETKDAAKDITGKALDKVTDKIKPIKAVKDKVKGIKGAINRAKQKIKDGIKKLAKEGIKAIGRAAVHGAKALGSFLAANPVIAAILVVVIVVICIYVCNSDIDDSMLSNMETDDMLLDNPTYVNTDGMSDNELVVILMDDCVSDSTSSITNEELITSEKVERATNVYSVFHSYQTGFNNASIAGMLANIDAESGIDPSAIEGIFSEYGVLGTRKAKAFLSIDSYTRTDLFPRYKNAGKSINEAGYRTTDSNGNNVYYCGLGLVQWTGGNAKDLLTAAETMNISWYSFDFQLAYMITDTLFVPGFFSAWVVDQFEGLTDDDYDDWYDEYTDGMTDEQIAALDPDTVSAAWEEAVTESWREAARQSALKFAHEYEGNDSDDNRRVAAAEVWYDIIAEWCDDDVDNDFSDSIADFAGQLGAIVEWVDISDAYYRCFNNTIYDNSSMTAAAISYAWPTKDQSINNNGTPLYITVHDAIMPNDHTYKSCDRTVGLAVLWSGTDDDYPPSGTNNQLPYLLSSPKWELVGMADGLSVGDLAPGDVLIVVGSEHGHTLMYVGPEAIDAAYAGEAKPGSNTVSGSLGTRSPSCNSDATSIFNSGGYDSSGRGPYYVFRCSDPDKSTKYTSIGAGMGGTKTGMNTGTETN